MRPFLKTAGWSFTVFYLYQAGLYLPEYFAPRSVMPCVTRMLDTYIALFVFPLGLVMACIVATDIRALHRSSDAGPPKWYTRARVAFGSAAVAATSVAVVRIMSAC